MGLREVGQPGLHLAGQGIRRSKIKRLAWMNKHESMEEKIPLATREKEYRVKAVWKTLQGEGLFAGRPAVFVRLVGCNLWSGYEATRERDALRTNAACPRWCDTDFTREGSQAYSAGALAEAMGDVGGPIRFCVLTGG